MFSTTDDSGSDVRSRDRINGSTLQSDINFLVSPLSFLLDAEILVREFKFEIKTRTNEMNAGNQDNASHLLLLKRGHTILYFNFILARYACQLWIETKIEYDR